MKIDYFEERYFLMPVIDPKNLDKPSCTSGSTKLTDASNIKTMDTRSFTIVIQHSLVIWMGIRSC